MKLLVYKKVLTMPNTREKLIELAEVIDSYFGCDAAYFDVDKFTLAKRIMEAGWIKQEWISVKDRLPQEKGEICKNVIMFMDDGLVTVGWLNEDTRCAFYLDTRNDFVSKVPISRCTHWMPLPQPPKGE